MNYTKGNEMENLSISDLHFPFSFIFKFISYQFNNIFPLILFYN